MLTLAEKVNAVIRTIVAVEGELVVSFADGSEIVPGEQLSDLVLHLDQLRLSLAAFDDVALRFNLLRR